MLVLFELLSGALLIWYAVLPFQNYQAMTSLCLGGIGLWLVALLIRRSRLLLSSSLFFHFSLILAYHLRAMMACGELTSWFLWIALGMWSVVLWLAVRFPDRPEYPSLFLIISIISLLFFGILNVREDDAWGLPIWILLVVRLLAAGNRKQTISIPWYLQLFLALTLVSIPFSLYYWRNVQFLLLNCSCVLIYCFCASRDKENSEPLVAGYLFLGLSLVSFVLVKEIFLLKHIGNQALHIPLVLFTSANGVSPLLILISCLLLYFLVNSQSRMLRITIAITTALLAGVELLTNSQSGWISYLLFALISAYSFFRPHLQKGTRRTWIAVSILIFFALAGSIFLSPPGYRIQGRLLSDFQESMYCWNVGSLERDG